MTYIETPKHKLLAFFLNVFLIFGLLWVPTPSDLDLPPYLANLDFYLTLFFVIPLIIQAKNIFKKTYIRFDSQGIMENISTSKEQFYPWTEVTGVRFFKVIFITYMVIDTKDPQKWFIGKNLFQKIKGRANYNRTKSPIHISLKNLDAKPQQIVSDLNSFFQKRAQS